MDIRNSTVDVAWQAFADLEADGETQDISKHPISVNNSTPSPIGVYGWRLENNFRAGYGLRLRASILSSQSKNVLFTSRRKLHG
jgi:hypothetical protein